MMQRAFLFCVFALLFSAANASDEEVARIEAKLQEIAATTSIDRPGVEMVDDYMSFFAEGSTVLPYGGDAIHGKQAIASFYSNAFSSIRIVSNKYSQAVVVVDGSIASVRYRGTAKFVTLDSEEAAEASNRYFDVWVKQEGEWKIIWHSFAPVT